MAHDQDEITGAAARGAGACTASSQARKWVRGIASSRGFQRHMRPMSKALLSLVSVHAPPAPLRTQSHTRRTASRHRGSACVQAAACRMCDRRPGARTSRRRSSARCRGVRVAGYAGQVDEWRATPQGTRSHTSMNLEKVVKTRLSRKLIPVTHTQATGSQPLCRCMLPSCCCQLLKACLPGPWSAVPCP